jgi:hypothetical protein
MRLGQAVSGLQDQWLGSFNSLNTTGTITLTAGSLTYPVLQQYLPSAPAPSAEPEPDEIAWLRRRVAEVSWRG